MGGLTLVVGNDDACNLQSRVGFTATAGTVYRIAIDGYYGASGNTILNWASLSPPDNDNFPSAQVISGSSGSVTGRTVGATRESGEPNQQQHPWRLVHLVQLHGAHGRSGQR